MLPTEEIVRDNAEYIHSHNVNSTMQGPFSPYVQPASYCENYPIMNYTLEVNSSLNREILASELGTNAEWFTLSGNLSDENTLYTIRILVANDVGTIPTSYRQIRKSFSFVIPGISI